MIILSEVLSKVKTLIEYAKCSIYFIEQYYDRNAEMYLPKSLDPFNPITAPFAIKGNNKITALRGSITSLGTGSYGCQKMTILIEIDLPNLNTITGNYMWQYCDNLKTVKLKALTNVTNNCLFQGCTNLKYIEFGTLEFFGNTVLQGCDSYETIVVGKGTKCNLFFFHSSNLTQECVHDIIDNVADRTGASELTLTVHQDVYNRISEEYKTKLSNKNWNLAVGS